MVRLGLLGLLVLLRALVTWLPLILLTWLLLVATALLTICRRVRVDHALTVSLAGQIHAPGVAQRLPAVALRLLGLGVLHHGDVQALGVASAAGHVDKEGPALRVHCPAQPHRQDHGAPGPLGHNRAVLRSSQYFKS